MSELTRKEIIEAFLAVAREGRPNSEQTFAAQKMFKQRIMDVQNPAYLKTFPSIPEEERPALQSDFLDGMGRIAGYFTGASFQTYAGYETLERHIPEHEEGVRHALRKIALELAMIEPRRF